MLTHSRRRLLLPVLICLIFLLLLPLISLGEEENPFTVTKDGESSEYDLSDPDSALSYAEGYGDNLSADPDFSVHIRQAIAAIRRNTPAYATIWSLVPPLVAIVLALTVVLHFIVDKLKQKKHQKGESIPLCSYIAPAYIVMWIAIIASRKI